MINPAICIEHLTTTYQALPGHSAFRDGKLPSHLSSCLLQNWGGATRLYLVYSLSIVLCLIALHQILCFLQTESLWQP